MALPEVLLAIVLSLPPPWHKPGANPESVDEYQARLETITQAIALEAEAAEGWRWDKQSLAAATLVVWYNESTFALEVHNGSHSSRYKEDNGRARCLGQLHQTGFVPKPEWLSLVGTDLEATRRCARATMRVLTAQGNRCGMRRNQPGMWAVARMYAAYASGNSCAPTKSSTARARGWSKVMEQLQTPALLEASVGRQG
jgi:hypothetical protein